MSRSKRRKSSWLPVALPINSTQKPRVGDSVMAFSPSGKWLMTGNQDCSIHVWNTDNGGEMHMRGYAAKVRQLAWHRGSRWLAIQPA